MKQQNPLLQRKSLAVEICAVKLSNFDAPLDPFIKKEYSQNQKIMRRRQYVKTPASLRKDGRQGNQSRSERYVKSSQESRLSFFIEGQIHQLNKVNDRMQHFSQLAKQKINELKTLMHLKSVSMKKTGMQVEKSFCFKQYKLNRRQNALFQQCHSLHSRNVKNSPFTKSIKAKKYLSKSMEMRNGNHSNLKQNQFKSIQLGAESKYGKIKKMVLLGGALNTKIRQQKNPENKQIQRVTENTAKFNSKRYSRQRKAPMLAKNIQDCENDCLPWQTFKGDTYFSHPSSP